MAESTSGGGKNTSGGTIFSSFTSYRNWVRTDSAP